MEAALGPDAGERKVFQSGTFTENPVSVAAGLAVLDVLEREPVLERADRAGELLRQGLQAEFDARDVPAVVTGDGLDPPGRTRRDRRSATGATSCASDLEATRDVPARHGRPRRAVAARAPGRDVRRPHRRGRRARARRRSRRARGAIARVGAMRIGRRHPERRPAARAAGPGRRWRWPPRRPGADSLWVSDHLLMVDADTTDYPFSRGRPADLARRHAVPGGDDVVRVHRRGDTHVPRRDRRARAAPAPGARVRQGRRHA